MYFESEKTILAYFLTDDFSIKKTYDLFDFRILINQKANNATVIIDRKLEGLGQKLDYVCLDITNDPKTDHLFNITNLGYYSIRITGENVDVFHFNDKTILKFPLDKFNVDYNMSLYLPEILLSKLTTIDSDICLFDFDFYNKNTYDVRLHIWKNNLIEKYDFNQLKIEDNFKVYKSREMDINQVMNKFINN